MYCSTSILVQVLGVCFLVASFSDVGGCSIVKIALSKHEYAEKTSGPNTINIGLSHVEHESTNQQTVSHGILKDDASKNVSGTSNDIPHSKIINGNPINEKQHPFLALVTIDKNIECGGSIISLNYVLTAAHCLEKATSPRSKVEVVLGVHDLQDTRNNQIYKVTHRIIHHGYSKVLREDNDIALLRLDRRITLNDYIQPISLPTTDTSKYKTAYSQGWGQTSDSNKYSPSPLQTMLRVWSTRECANSLSNDMFADPRIHICAGGDKNDTCHGDSGGPLFVESRKGNRILIGVVARGHGCAKPGYPGVYTRVESYLDWIAENTEDGIY